MNTTHRGWTIEIVPGRFDSTCWVTSPAGDEFKLFVPKSQHVNDTLAMARAFVNRLIRLDQEETPCQA